MADSFVYDFSATAASNATLAGFGVAEGMPRNRVSDAFRAIMESSRRFYDWWGRVSVKRYGAVGDGVTNDTAAIQAAITSGAKALWFPAGTYLVTAALTQANNARWYGDGYEASIIQSNVNGYLVETTVSNRRLGAADMGFTGLLANALSGGLKLFDPATFGFYRCQFKNFTREGLRLVQAVNVTVDDCLFANCGTRQSAAVTISNATPGVVTWTAHGLANGTPVYFTTTGTLPTGLALATMYFVRNAATNTFELASAAGAGSSIATSSAGSGTHTAFGLPYGAIYSDPGATANVQINLRGGYISGCGIGFNAKSTRTIKITGVTFESNTLGAFIWASDGKIDSRYFEANTFDILQSDSGVKVVDGVGTNMQLCWDGSATKDRSIENDHKGFASVYRNTSITPGGTGWEDVSFVTLGNHYQATCAVTAAPVVVDHKGVYDTEYRVTFLADAIARSAAMRLVSAATSGGAYTEVEGSWVGSSLVASETKTLVGKCSANLVASGAVKLQYSVSNVAVTIASTGVTGTTAPTYAAVARLDIGHSGTEK